MKKVLVLASLLLASFGASAATYDFSPVTYTAPTPFAVCGIGTCANFSTAMGVTASFTTAAPLPPKQGAAHVVGDRFDYLQIKTAGVSRSRTSDAP